MSEHMDQVLRDAQAMWERHKLPLSERDERSVWCVLVAGELAYVASSQRRAQAWVVARAATQPGSGGFLIREYVMDAEF